MRHAVLIMAHNNWNILDLLLKQLEHPDIDVYLHIDKKALHSFNRSGMFLGNVKLVESHDMGYCDYSMVDAAFELLETAVRGGYNYYHMISGVDMMLVSAEKFVDFFEHNKGKEFVGFSDKDFTRNYIYRNYFNGVMRERNIMKKFFLLNIRRSIILFQKGLHLKNIKAGILGEIKKGSDWWSVTHDAVKLAIEKKRDFKNGFYRAYCPTEFLMQTVIWNSCLKGNLNGYCVDSNMREIDWDRGGLTDAPGGPYVWRVSDLERLKNSGKLFARKFDEKIDFRIVEEIYHYTKN